jgi:hypothetical protein
MPVRHGRLHEKGRPREDALLRARTPEGFGPSGPGDVRRWVPPRRRRPPCILRWRDRPGLETGLTRGRRQAPARVLCLLPKRRRLLERSRRRPPPATVRPEPATESTLVRRRAPHLARCLPPSRRSFHRLLARWRGWCRSHWAQPPPSALRRSLRPPPLRPLLSPGYESSLANTPSSKRPGQTDPAILTVSGAETNAACLLEFLATRHIYQFEPLFDLSRIGLSG